MTPWLAILLLSNFLLTTRSTFHLRCLAKKRRHRIRTVRYQNLHPPSSPMTSDSQLDVNASGPTEHEDGAGGQMSFFEHLIELRKRIINSLLAIAVGAAIGWFAAPRFIGVVAIPIKAALRKH